MMAYWYEKRELRVGYNTKIFNLTKPIWYFISSTAPTTTYNPNAQVTIAPFTYTLDGVPYTLDMFQVSSNTGYSVTNLKKQTLIFKFRDTNKNSEIEACFLQSKLFYSDSTYVLHELDSNAYTLTVDKTTHSNYYLYTYTIDFSKLSDTFYNTYNVNFTPLLVFLTGYNYTPIQYMQYNIACNKGHVSLNVLSSGELEYNTNFNFIATAREYHKITNCTSTIGTVSIAPDGSSATISGVVTGTIDINIESEAIGTYTVFNSGKNIRLTSDKEKYLLGESFTITVTPTNTYIIDWLNCNQLKHDIIISSDKKSATITGIVDDNIYIYGNAILATAIQITGVMKNCSCNYNNGEVATHTKPIIITANNGYTFEGVYSFNSGAWEFEKSIDKTTLTFEISQYDIEYERITEWILDDQYVATKQVESINQFTSIYTVDSEQLATLAKNRYAISSNVDNVEYFDYGTFITTLYKYPIEFDYESVVNNIVLGILDTKIQTNLLLEEYATINIGSIFVSSVYGDYRDYNSSYVLHSPFFETIELEPYYVVNQTLTIQYKLDLYRGYTTISIHSTYNDKIVYISTIDNSIHIPFIQNELQRSINSYSNNYNLNNIDKAYIECIHSKQENNLYTHYNQETSIYDTIGNFTGYTVISDIDISSNMTSRELQELKQILRQGVIINE